MDTLKVRSAPGKGTTVVMRKKISRRPVGRGEHGGKAFSAGDRPAGKQRRLPASAGGKHRPDLEHCAPLQRQGVDAEDLYQLGCLGFLKAVRGFDAEYGTQFSTYAVPKIAGEIRRFLRDDGMVKVGRGVKERAGAIRLARDRLSHALGREPTLSELADETGLEPEEIAIAETATVRYFPFRWRRGRKEQPWRTFSGSTEWRKGWWKRWPCALP